MLVLVLVLLWLLSGVSVANRPVHTVHTHRLTPPSWNCTAHRIVWYRLLLLLDCSRVRTISNVNLSVFLLIVLIGKSLILRLRMLVGIKPLNVIRRKPLQIELRNLRKPTLS